MELNPESADIHDAYGSALAKQGHLNEAKQEFATAIKSNPRLAEAHNNLGLVMLSSARADTPGDFAGAENEFKTAISLDAHYAEAQNNLGTLYGQQGGDAQAEQLFREAIENRPTFPDAFVNLGAILASESRFAEDEATLNKALQIDPDNKQAQDLRAMIEARKDVR